MENALATSRWATKEEIFEARYVRERGGKDADFLIGETDFLVRDWYFDRTKRHYFIGGKTDQHALVCMGARGGKGTSVIVPNLIFWGGSCVVVDPKGENATLTAARRGRGQSQEENYVIGMNQKTLVLDPFLVSKVDDEFRATFNPLDAVRVDDDEAIDEAGRIADAIVVQDGDKDSHWNETARYLIKGLILHVLTDPDFEGERNLIAVRKLIVSGDTLSVNIIRQANADKAENDPERVYEPDPFEMLWQGMLDNPACDGVISGVGQSFLAMADKERSSVLSTAARNTEFIESPQMRKSLEHSSFELSELKTSMNGVSLFLSLPTRYMGTHKRWLRMLVTLTLDEMEKIPHQPKCGYPVLMILDEFPGLGRMKRIEDATSQIPGYGVKLAFICQSLSQLKEVYKDNWETFIACSGISLFAANQDEFTLKYLTRRLGESEISRMVSSSGRNRGSSFLKPWTLFTGSNRGKSQQLHKRALLSEDEMSRTFAPSENKILAFVSGLPPMTLNRTPYFSTRYFHEYVSAHPDHSSMARPSNEADTPRFWYDAEAARTSWFDRFDVLKRNDKVIPDSTGYTTEGNVREDAFVTTLFAFIVYFVLERIFGADGSAYGVLLGLFLATLGVFTLAKGIRDKALFLAFMVATIVLIAGAISFGGQAVAWVIRYFY